METEFKEGKIVKIKEYNNFTLKGIITVYQLNFVDRSGRKHSDVMVTYDSGVGGEEFWGIGVDLFDALEVASMQFDYYFEGEIKDENPFKELLSRLQND